MVIFIIRLRAGLLGNREHAGGKRTGDVIFGFGANLEGLHQNKNSSPARRGLLGTKEQGGELFVWSTSREERERRDAGERKRALGTWKKGVWGSADDTREGGAKIGGSWSRRNRE